MAAFFTILKPVALHRFFGLFHFLGHWLLPHATGVRALGASSFSWVGGLPRHRGAALALTGLGRGECSCQHEGASGRDQDFLHCKLQWFFVQSLSIKRNICCSTRPEGEAEVTIPHMTRI